MVPSGSTCGCDIRLPPNAHWRLCPTLDYERGKSKHSFAPFFSWPLESKKRTDFPPFPVQRGHSGHGAGCA